MVGGSMGTGIETSMRYSGQSKTLRIHAKEKLPLDSKTLIQAHGEVETGAGHPRFLAMSIRRFFPEHSASFGVGFEFNSKDKFGYNIRGKRALGLTSNGMLVLNMKGRCDTDKNFNQKNARGAVELAWSILDFQKDQDVRVKLGYDLLGKVPYFQIRENNWTLNADINCNWNVRFDL
ncbi:outer envelope pore protein 21B, chloroplastic [Phalaenopsis equestris]|uniref:outer envelope pore protein 21B, chloroplastic n=1 Tax=Phalaenopsis equestris TaxID=78828 RepID=UPI0009E46A5C|nr:outer envelope pore protein 21B, chloroplastic [Phalaenopsis equestris]